MVHRIHAIIFDFDDTILATFESRTPCIIQAAADFGYKVSMTDVKGVWGKPFKDMIFSLMPRVDYLAFYDHYRDVMAQHPPTLKPGTQDILKYLKTLDLYIAVVSSSSRILIWQDLNAVNLLKYIDSIWGHESSSYHKPDPRVLEPIIDYLKERDLHKEACVYVGDSRRDYLAAKGNQIDFFAVTTGHEESKDFLELGLEKDRIFSNLLELLEPQSCFMRLLTCEPG